MTKPADKSEKDYYVVQSTFEEAMLNNDYGTKVSKGLQTLFTGILIGLFFGAIGGVSLGWYLWK